jgi:2-keto-4-pentenoate hydratase/2-oxohepta-3-ene-1,7-dioic acid hydratase in catechol pathway
MPTVPTLFVPTIAISGLEQRFPVRRIYAALSTYVEVAPGDLIFTGTPAGVGPIKRGQSVRAEIAGIEPIEITFEK